MINEEKIELKETIRTEISRLEKSIPNLKESSKAVEPDNAIGRLSRMEAINSKHMAEATLKNAVERLQKLKLALTKIDDEDFGICLECEEPIAIKRLMLVPETKLCVECMKD